MHVYLFRHGQSVENTQAWDGRNQNSPLTDLGHAQAEALANWATDHIQLDALYISTMQRTRQTAAPLINALNINAVYSDHLREVGNAYPDGSPFPDDALPRYFVSVWGSLHPYKPITEGGENWMQFRSRVGGFIEQIVAEAPAEHYDYRVGMVCHGGVIEGVFEHVFQKGPISPVNVNTRNTGITHLEYYPAEGRPNWWLHSHNSTAHLTPDLVS